MKHYKSEIKLQPYIWHQKNIAVREEASRDPEVGIISLRKRVGGDIACLQEKIRYGIKGVCAYNDQVMEGLLSPIIGNCHVSTFRE